MASKPQFENPSVQAQFEAGNIGADGIGIPSEYPKMLYKSGEAVGHDLDEKPLAIDNRKGDKAVQTLIVQSADEEAEALADGWFMTPALTLTPEQLKQKEIDDLKAQLAAEQKKGRKKADPAEQPEAEQQAADVVAETTGAE